MPTVVYNNPDGSKTVVQQDAKGRETSRTGITLPTNSTSTTPGYTGSGGGGSTLSPPPAGTSTKQPGESIEEFVVRTHPEEYGEAPKNNISNVSQLTAGGRTYFDPATKTYYYPNGGSETALVRQLKEQSEKMAYNGGYFNDAQENTNRKIYGSEAVNKNIIKSINESGAQFSATNRETGAVSNLDARGVADLKTQIFDYNQFQLAQARGDANKGLSASSTPIKGSADPNQAIKDYLSLAPLNPDTKNAIMHSTKTTASPIIATSSISPNMLTYEYKGFSGTLDEVNDFKEYRDQELGKELFNNANFLEKAGLVASTLFSSSGSELIGSLVPAPVYDFVGVKKNRDVSSVIYGRTSRAYDTAINPDLTPSEILLPEMFGNPGTKIGIMTGFRAGLRAVGGAVDFGLGKVGISGVANVGKYAITPGQAVEYGAGAGFIIDFVISEGSKLSGDFKAGRNVEAVGDIITDVAGFYGGAKGFKSDGVPKSEAFKTGKTSDTTFKFKNKAESEDFEFKTQDSSTRNKNIRASSSGKEGFYWTDSSGKSFKIDPKTNIPIFDPRPGHAKVDAIITPIEKTDITPTPKGGSGTTITPAKPTGGNVDFIDPRGKSGHFITIDPPAPENFGFFNTIKGKALGLLKNKNNGKALGKEKQPEKFGLFKSQASSSRELTKLKERNIKELKGDELLRPVMISVARSKGDYVYTQSRDLTTTKKGSIDKAKGRDLEIFDLKPSDLMKAPKNYLKNKDTGKIEKYGKGDLTIFGGKTPSIFKPTEITRKAPDFLDRLKEPGKLEIVKPRDIIKRRPDDIKPRDKPRNPDPFKGGGGLFGGGEGGDPIFGSDFLGFKRSSRKFNLKEKYTPSLEAVVFNKRAKKGQGKRLIKTSFSGFELRPII